MTQVTSAGENNRSGGASSSLELKGHLRRWGLWLRLVESLRWGTWAAAVGMVAGLLLALAARMWPLLLTRWIVVWAGLLMISSTVFGVGVVWMWPRSLFRLARIFDDRLDLAERLTTAIEIEDGRLRTTRRLAQAQLADSLRVAGSVDVRSRIPLRASRRTLLTLSGLVLGLALTLWLPNPQEDVLLRRIAVRGAVEEQIEELEAMREKVAESGGLTEAEQEALLRELEKVIAALDEGRATAEEGVTALSEAEQSLAELQDPGAASIENGLEHVADGMADSELTRDIAEALKSGDYEAAAQGLAAYGGTKGAALTRGEELELAKELAEAAEALTEADPELAEQLSAAAEAIEQGDIATAREVIREAAREMGEAGERVERQEAVEGALAQLQEGRDEIAQAGDT
jgi:hypothetical protein